MGKIKLTVSGIIIDGRQISFQAPCSSENTTGLTINNTTYTIADANGSSVAGVSGLWVKDAMLSAILDATNKKAYIQNANTSRKPIGSVIIVFKSAPAGYRFSLMNQNYANIVFCNAEARKYLSVTGGTASENIKVLKDCILDIHGDIYMYSDSASSPNNAHAEFSYYQENYKSKYWIFYSHSIVANGGSYRYYYYSPILENIKVYSGNYINEMSFITGGDDVTFLADNGTLLSSIIIDIYA